MYLQVSASTSASADFTSDYSLLPWLSINKSIPLEKLSQDCFIMINVLGTACFCSSFAARHLSTENSKSPLKMCQVTVANLKTLCHFQVCEHHNISAPVDLLKRNQPQ